LGCRFHGTFSICLREQIYLSDNGAWDLARRFKKIIFTHFGVPWVLISDNGAPFIEKKLEALLKKYGVHHKLGLGYHYRTSGKILIWKPR